MNLIEVDNITREYGANKALDSVSFKVRTNTIHGILGPNGAGKTTTIKILCGLIPSSSGQVLFEGKSIDINDKNILAQIGALIDEPALFVDMKVCEFLEYILKIYKVDKSLHNEYLAYALDELELVSVSDRLIKNLSKGFRQKVAVAAAIIHRPKLIILDEPTVGLDPNAILKMRSLLLKLKKNHTLIITSHILSEMDVLCDDITLINNGKVVLCACVENLQVDHTTVEIKLKSSLEIEKIKQALLDANINLEDISFKKRSLEQIFFERIKAND
ncbi:MAG: ABC transporter ATP-binding protein [Bacteriovoracaceae bacterium]|jgi:ABC-2 type transport system ATP-binding protein|nr:ABC transporter ATP-binding protein [Bacteriovoracaceae bacterium]